jgi:hypothetical protein
MDDRRVATVHRAHGSKHRRENMGDTKLGKAATERLVHRGDEVLRAELQKNEDLMPKRMRTQHANDVRALFEEEAKREGEGSKYQGISNNA